MKKIFIKKNIPIFILLLLSVGISLSFLGESVGRTISLILITSSFLITFLFSQNITFSILIFLLLALPLNITYQIPLPFEKSLVDGISVNYLIPTLSLLDVGLGLFIVVVEIKERGIIKKVFGEYKYPLLLFSAFLLIQNLVLKNPLVLLSSLRFILYYSSFLIFLKLWKVERRKINYEVISVTLLFSVLSQGIVGIIQFAKGSSLGLNFLGESKGVVGLVGSSFVALGDELFLRASGTFPHPNVLAGFLLFSFFFALFLTKKLQKNHRIVSYLIMALCSSFVIFTFSRTIIFLFGAIFLVLGIKKLSSRKELFSLTTPLLLQRFLSIFADSDSSWVDRVSLMKASFVVIRQNSLLGTGLGNYVKGMEGFFPTTSRSMPLLQPVHNIFLLLFAELGIFGFLLYIYLLAKILRNNYKRVTMYSLLIFFSILVIGMVDHYFLSLPQGQLTFLLLISLAIIESNEKLQDYK